MFLETVHQEELLVPVDVYYGQPILSSKMVSLDKLIVFM